MFDHFDCAKCSAQQQTDRGCERNAPFPYWTDVLGEKRSRCPRRPILENPLWFNRLIGAYNAYKNGFMPHAGGLNDQAALYPDLMSVIDGTIQQCDKIRADRDTGRGAGGSVSILESGRG